MRIRNEYSAFSSSASDNAAILFNEATFVIELDLHSLLHDLADRDQILCYSWNMQDVLDVGLFVDVLVRDISNMLNGVYYVVPSFKVAGSIKFSQL